MTFLYENRQIRELERRAIEAGIESYTLMCRAGQGAFSVLQSRWPDAERIIVCAGKGNNAGDGFEVARLAHQHGLTVVVYSIIDPTEYKGAAKLAAQAAVDAGVKVLPYNEGAAYQGDLIVDALLGSGLEGEVKEPFVSWINSINDQNIDVFSLDVPSGLDVDTGCILGAAIDADATVTFIGLKKGLYTRKGPARCGMIVLKDLDIPAEIFNHITPSAKMIGWEQVRTVLPKRKRESHKGNFGHVLVIGGDYGMGGAVRMAAEGALRVGAGLVTVATRPEHVPVVSSSRPEIMCFQVADAQELDGLLQKASVLVIGPGLGRSAWAEGLLQKVLQSDKPKLLDADALNLLSQQPAHCDNWILTPHPGEAGRLLGVTCQEVQADRFGAIQELEKRYGGVTVLKGAGTLVKGESEVVSVCRAGNPGMASGGMGDILSGIISGLLAQHLSLQDAAEVGVYVHARAGDLAVQEGGGERGLLATDIFVHMRHLVNP